MSTESLKSADRGAERRTLRGLVVRPKEQLKFAFVVVGGGMFLLTSCLGLTIIYLNRVIETLEGTLRLDHDAAASIRDTVSSVLNLGLISGVVFTVLSILVGLQVSNRVYGPLIPILRHIGEMKGGNFSNRIHLRKDDELQEVQDALNDLAEDFGKKYPLE